jgi:hypothetical protein
VTATAMSFYFSRFNANQRVWGAIGAVIVTGTVFKVRRLSWCWRVLIVPDLMERLSPHIVFLKFSFILVGSIFSLLS